MRKVKKISEQFFGGTNSYANAIAIQGNNTFLTAGYSSNWGDPAGDLFYMESSNTSVSMSPENTGDSYIFPNPVKSRSSVMLPSSYAYQTVQLEVTDITGRHTSCKENTLGKGRGDR